MDRRYPIIALFLVRTVTIIYGAPCSTGDRVGYVPPVTTWVVDTVSTGDGYVMTDPSYWINCCGKVASVEFLPLSMGAIEFYAYRYNKATSTYDVVASYSTTVTPIEKDAVTTKPIGGQFSVKEGDLMGWYTAGSDIIGRDITVVPVGKHASLTPPVTSFNWDAEQTNAPGAAHIAMHLEPSSAPSFSSIPTTESFQDTSMSVGQIVHTLTSSDPDDTVLKVTMDTSSSYFELDPAATGKVKVKTIPPTGSYTIQFTVKDLCENSDVQTLQIDITSEPPAITNLDAAITIAADDPGNKELLALTVTDPTNDEYKCKIDSTNPAGAPVSLVVENMQDYSIWLDANPSLTAGTIEVDISCQDESGATSAVGKYTITVTANNAPVWDDSVFPVGKSVDIKIRDIKTGSSIYDVKATDAENDDLTYDMVCVPSVNCPFVSTKNGQIFATRTILTDKIDSYDLQITVSDGSSVTGPRSLKVNVLDVNDIPTFPASAATVSVPETTTAGSVLYTVSATDIDLDSLKYSAAFTPVSGSELFELDYSPDPSCTNKQTSCDYWASQSYCNSYFNYMSTNCAKACRWCTDAGDMKIKLKSGANIDYETVSDYNYVITFVANDGLEDSLPFELTLQITPENEPPAFEQSKYGINIDEGVQNGDAGFSFGSSWVSDPDYNDQLKFSLDSACPLAGYVTMDEYTGVTHFNSHYDIDNPTLKATTMDCVVTVTDKAGETDTATLTMQLEDVNDNTPTFIDPPYTFTATNQSVAGTVVGKVEAEDLDLTDPNNEITYISSDPCGVKEDGSVYLSIDVTGYAIGHVLNCVVTARDDGDPQLSSSETVTITIVEPVTTTTTTTTTQATTSSSSFDAKLIWIPLLALALLGLMGLGLYIAARYCKCCKGRCCRCCRPHHGKHNFKHRYPIDDDRDRAFYRSPPPEAHILP